MLSVVWLLGVIWFLLAGDRVAMNLTATDHRDKHHIWSEQDRTVFRHGFKHTYKTQTSILHLVLGLLFSGSRRNIPGALYFKIYHSFYFTFFAPKLFFAFSDGSKTNTLKTLHISCGAFSHKNWYKTPNKKWEII